MKFVIQRTKEAKVVVDGVEIGAIDHGYVVFIGISDADNTVIADKMIAKLIGLRIFEDESGKSNLSINDERVMGELLLISQFTLYADCSHGNRPSYINAGAPVHANTLYEYICNECKAKLGSERVKTGEFGADMKVSLLNDGPFTILFDSDEMIRS